MLYTLKMENIQLTLVLSEAEYAALIASMHEAGFTSLESFVCSVLAQRRDG